MKPKAKKQLGQHWLKDEAVLQKIVQSAQVKPDDLVVEIGPGTGNLTFFLGQTGAQILAIEKDFSLIERLNNRLKRFKNIKIIQADARFFDYDFTALKKATDWKLVANLPYNITTFFLRQILILKNPPSKMILMMQKEVAQKIVAPAGDSRRSVFTLFCLLAGKSKILFFVGKELFSPAPKVDSAVIEIIPQKWSIKKQTMLKFIKLGFSAKRRKLANNLLGALHFPKDYVYNVLKVAGVDEDSRAEDLKLKDWEKLYEKFQRKNG